MNDQGTEFEGAKIESPKDPYTVLFHSTILKEIRSWAISLLILGVLHISISGFLSAPYGIMLIMVGLASFYLRSSAMLVVYAITLAWAGISNLFGGQALWIGFAILQWFLAFRVFQKYRSFWRTEAKSNEEESASSGLTPKRSASIFPWAAAALGIFSLIGLIGIFVGVILLAIFSPSQTVPEFMSFSEGLAVNFGLLGFAIGLASILCKYPKGALAIIGVVSGFLTILIEMVLIFI